MKEEKILGNLVFRRSIVVLGVAIFFIAVLFVIYKPSNILNKLAAHSPTQTFGIISISKASKLDQDLNVLEDVYEKVQKQDKIWTSVKDGQYVRVTFEKILDNTKDITIYAKTNDPAVSASVEVFPVYTNADGDQIEGDQLTTVSDGRNPDFSSIEHEDTYKVLLTNLQTPTDVFDLKISGNVYIDYIVDPTCPGSMTGSGTLGDPCQVTSWTNLDAIDGDLTLYYILTANLSSSDGDYAGIGNVWTPLGTFTGTFDGDNHTISNLIVASTANAGLFSINSGTILDVGLLSVSITAASSGYGGAIAAQQSGGSMTNCYSSGTIVSSGAAYLGGIVGYAPTGNITSCHSSANITVANGTLPSGGLVGRFGSGTLSSSHATGNVTNNGDSSHGYSGGLVGYILGSTINNCYATGVVDINGMVAGGLIGYISSGTVNGSFATGNVTGVSNIGGFVGMVGGKSAGGSIYNCYAMGNVTGTTVTGGFAGGSKPLIIDKCFSKGSVSMSGGGFVGSVISGTFTNDFWDTESSGQTTSAGGAGVVGKTTTEMKDITTFSAYDIATTSIADLNSEYPFLSWQEGTSATIWVIYSAPSIVVDIFGSMFSTNYIMEVDSINFGGTENSLAGDFMLSDTMGEVSTGVSSSTSYAISAGYRTLTGSYISISAGDDVVIPTMTGLTPGESDSAESWLVKTDNPAGYELLIKSLTSPAMMSVEGSSFSDYTTSASGTPDYIFSVAPTDSVFAFSPEGEDISQTYLDDGVDCGTGNYDTADRCWDGFLTTEKVIAYRTTSNHPDGTITNVKYKTAIGSNKIQDAGTYSSTIQVTAVTL